MDNAPPHLIRFCYVEWKYLFFSLARSLNADAVKIFIPTALHISIKLALSDCLSNGPLIPLLVFIFVYFSGAVRVF